MVNLKRIIIGVFSLVWLLPLVFFNGQPQVASAIDNRKLTEFPFGRYSTAQTLDEKISQLSDYAADRIGFRDRLVAEYTLLHATLFGDLVHPSYMLGKDDYVFLNKTSNVEFSEYHETFAQMVIQLDRYLKARGVPFLFVFTPEKASILQDKLPTGMNYSNQWVNRLLQILETNQVEVIDNTQTMNEWTEKGEVVFNRQYDAGHWNDRGAFYGVNAILAAAKGHFPEIGLNSLDQFTVTQQHNAALPASSFPIDEYEPVFSPAVPVENITEQFPDLGLDPEFPYFYATANPRAESPRTLVFQGSYMNNLGYKFMSNALDEYYAVHAYQNILELDRLYNFFLPELVIFEVAEYTINNRYFDQKRMETMELPEFEPASDQSLSQ